MLVPGAEFPHFCAQCHDHPCVNSCPVGALSVSEETEAILVDKEKCTGCGLCIDACPGRIPHMHPTESYALICDLCGGEPQCAKICQRGGWGALRVVKKPLGYSYRLYAKTPEEVTGELVFIQYGEKGQELI